MARQFDGAADAYRKTDGTPVTGAPSTMCGWINPDTLSGFDTPWQSSEPGGPPYNHMQCDLNGSAGRVCSQSAAAGGCAAPSSSFGTGSWQHYAGVYASSTDRKAYRNGGDVGTNTVDVTPAGLVRFVIGRLEAQSVITNYFDGAVAHVTAWSSALAADEVNALAKGAHPYNVHRGSLAAYWPLEGSVGGRDLLGGYALTEVGAPAEVGARPLAGGP